MRPASRILTYLMAALVIPGLSFFMLPILLLLPLLALFHFHRNPLKLVWRTRWLLLILLLGYAYSLPGQAALVVLGDWSPSLPGIERGSVQVLRLVILLLWLDLLVLRLDSKQLMSGIYNLLKPLAGSSVLAERFSLRLGLTLRSIEGQTRGHGNLARLFDAEPDDQPAEQIHLQREPLRASDLLPALLVLGVGMWSWLSV